MSDSPNSPSEVIKSFVAQTAAPQPAPPLPASKPLDMRMQASKMVADWLAENGKTHAPTEQDMDDFQAFLSSSREDEVAEEPVPTPPKIETEADRNKRLRAENEAKVQADLDAKIKENNETVAKGETPEAIANEHKRIKFRFANEALRAKTFPIADPFFADNEDGDGEYLYKALILKKPTGGQIRDWLREKAIDPNATLPVYYREDGKPFPPYLIDNALDIELQNSVNEVANDFLSPLFQ